MRRTNVLIFLLIAGLLWSVGASAAVRAWLDRSSMQLGETVTLNVESDDSTAAEPDFGALLGDFNSLGTQSSRQISMTNGSTSAKTVWAVGLEPKHAGSLTIPAFTIGGQSSDPLNLTVLPAPLGAQGKPGDTVFVEVSADPLNPYVQQQVRYTVKLYYAVNLSDGSLDEPAAGNAVVQKLGRDKQYNSGTERHPDDAGAEFPRQCGRQFRSDRILPAWTQRKRTLGFVAARCACETGQLGDCAMVAGGITDTQRRK